MSQLRLAAGASMLKICEQKGVGDQFTAEQFINLSRLMNGSMKFVSGKVSMKYFSWNIHVYIIIESKNFFSFGGQNVPKSA